MPIIGMTRRQDVEDATHRLVYGVLRKGGPKTDPKKPGPELEYWRFTSERQDLCAAFASAYPDKPRMVDAYLPFPDMERNWQTWFEEYDAGGLRHRCDGRTMTRWRKPDGSYQDGEQPCPYFAGRERTKENPGCKQVGRLYLVLPALIKAGFVGLVTMETHSINDLISITASLMDIEAKAGGRLNGILLSVIRVKETISTPAWKDEDKHAGKRNRTAKHLVKVVPQAEWVMAHLQVEANEQMALAHGKPLELERRSANVANDWHDDDDDDDADDADDDDLLEFAEPELPDSAPEDCEDAEDAEFEAMTSATDERANTPAAKIIARLRDLGSNDDQPLDEATSKKLWGNLSSLTGRNAARSKELVSMIYGVDHSDKLTLGQANTLIGWINSRPVKDEQGKTMEWVPAGPALSAGEYKILFPPEPELLPAE